MSKKFVATCETNGHLWGVGDTCIMCGSPKPKEDRMTFTPVEMKSGKNFYVCPVCSTVVADAERHLEIERRCRLGVELGRQG